MRSKRKKTLGQGYVEAITAAFVLIPIALCLLDFIVLVIANQMNDTAAKNAARAAANQGTKQKADQAADKALLTFQKSPFIDSIKIESLVYPDVNESVTVTTKMVVNLPVPFPGYGQMTFLAKDAP